MTSTISAKTISVKSLAAVAASSLAIIGGMSALHANYVIPRIMMEAREIIEKEIGQHERMAVHPGTISRAEVESRMTSIDQRLSRIEARLDRALDGKGGDK